MDQSKEEKVSVEKCGRCQQNTAEFSCVACEPFRIYCSKCDNYLHSLPSKKTHIRTPLKDTKGEEINKSVSIFHDKNSPIQENSQKMDTVYLNTVSDRRFMRTSDTFSSTYVNELKIIFEKEKNELIYKNNSLQNNLDKLKTTFGEQIHSLQNQLETLNMKSMYSIKNIEDNHQKNVENLLKLKDDEIKRLNEIITNLESQVKDHKGNSMETNTFYETKIIKYEEKIKELELTILAKETNLKEKEDGYLRQIKIIEENNKMEKEGLIKLYEETIKKIEDDFIKNKTNYRDIIDANNSELQKICDKFKDQEEYYQRLIKELKEENLCHKQNVLSIRGKKLAIEKKIENYDKISDNWIKELKLLESRIKIKDEQIEYLSKENCKKSNEKIRISRLWEKCQNNQIIIFVLTLRVLIGLFIN